MTIDVDYFPRRRSTAFTLVELMISIALALLLILGVNQIFKYTTQAVGAGQAISADIQSSRAAQAAFAEDFNGIVGSGTGPADSACMVISSRASYGYSNAQEQAAEGAISGNAPATGSTGYPSNNAAFLDLDGDGQFGNANIPGEVVYPCVYNRRNHRLDTLSFFSRDQFHRQTGNPGTFVDNMGSTEAWIWYGHLWLPSNDPTNLYSGATFPLAGNAGTSAGIATNPNNFYGSQLVLGRVAMLLREKSTSNTILDPSGNQQWFIDRSGGSTLGNLTPLYCGSQLNETAYPTSSTDPGVNGNNLYNSRVDLASTSISNYRQKLQSYISTTYSPTNSSTWWWTFLMDGSSTTANGGFSRFQCNPFVAKPMQAVDTAHASPYFISGCSQFIVEYAGDFVTQDNNPSDTTIAAATATTPAHVAYGNIIATSATASAPDGVIDFTLVNIGTSGNPNYQKQIKWYGMPRGTAGQTTICYSNGDVVPLRDWLQQAWTIPTASAMPPTQTPLAAAPFEKIIPPYTATNYGNGFMTPTNAQNGYVCAFSSSDVPSLRPKLIRITITLEDPNGRLPDGLTYQYVFQVP